jgi:hypothetical protein
MVKKLDFTNKKEKIKELAKKSVIFSISDDIYNEFIKALNLIKDDKKGQEALDFLIKCLANERKEIIKKCKKIIS